jgi:hypothetical protein
MTKIEDIKKAVEQLSPQDFAMFRAWFEEFEARVFDKKSSATPTPASWTN